MTNVVLLNNVDHHDLRIVTGHGARWGEAINQVAVLPSEFAAVQRDFPILFRRDEAGAFQALALLGLDRDENLFLDGERWTARYVPALLEREPFSIGVPAGAAGGDPMIHVDLDHPRVARDRGAPLFLPHGGNAPHLDRIAKVLRTIHAGHEMQAPMFAAFEAAALLQPVRLEIMLDDTLRYDLVEYHAIDAGALAGLGGEQLAALHRHGFLVAAFHATSSLANVERLIALKNRKRERG